MRRKVLGSKDYPTLISLALAVDHAICTAMPEIVDEFYSCGAMDDQTYPVCLRYELPYECSTYRGRLNLLFGENFRMLMPLWYDDDTGHVILICDFADPNFIEKVVAAVRSAYERKESY